MKNLESFSVLDMKAKEMTEIKGGAFAAVMAAVVAGGVITIVAGTLYAVAKLLSKYSAKNGTR